MPGMNRWGVFLFGAGFGVAAAATAGQSALVPGVVVGVVGLLLLGVGGRRAGGNLVEDATAAHDGVKKGDKPTLSGLGTRVEEILSLAQEQAAEHVRAANDEAAHIVADARAKAKRINPE